MTTSDAFAIDSFLDRHWAALAARLGDRREAFLQRVAECSRERGFAEGVQAARFANLCCAFGTGFENRTENEWALAILLDDRLLPWVRLHQLVWRGGRELDRRGPEGVALATQLRDNDLRVLAAFEAAPGSARAPDGTALPRVACDIEAAEVRLLDTDWRQEYQLVQGEFQRRPVQPVAPLRIDLRQPAPELLHVLTRPPGLGTPSRIQVRQVQHGRCGRGLHPALKWADDSGPQTWRDEGARGPAWAPALAAQVVADAAGQPALLAEESAATGLIDVPSCGLRDEGPPQGALRLPVFSYPGWQWLLQFDRQALLGADLPGAASPPAAAPSRWRCERDGQAHAVPAWQDGFDRGLGDAAQQGWQRLLQAWQPQVKDATLRAECRLFDGHGHFTWGWREGPRGLASPPLQRVVADLDWLASLDLHLGGRVAYAGASSQLHLVVQGDARLTTTLERLMADAPLAQVLQGAVLRWRWPVRIDFDPEADDTGCLFSELGPATGAVVGSLGLRPDPRRGGAWQWYVSMSIEPVSVRVVVHDPVLGRSESRLALLGSVPLIDWSLG